MTDYPQFVPGPHPSHEWTAFNDGEDVMMCSRCEICTCHSPVASREECEYAVHEPSDSATP